jgi:hypothetical protein
VITIARTMKAEDVAKIEKKQARNRRFMCSPDSAGRPRAAVDDAVMD